MQTVEEDTLQRGVWGLNKSEFIDPSVEHQDAELPNCTASQTPKHWRVTNSTMKAYVAMRGPYQEAGRDLFAWLDRCAKTSGNPKKCGPNVGSCESIISSFDPMFQDPAPPDEAHYDKDVFLVPRPPLQHLKAPVGFKGSEREYIASREIEPVLDGPSSKEDDYDPIFDISDAEGDIDDGGRISPCTFRLWAEGCVKWDIAGVDEDEKYPPHPTDSENINDVETGSTGEAVDESDSHLPPSQNPYLQPVEDETPATVSKRTNFHFHHKGRNEFNNYGQVMGNQERIMAESAVEPGKTIKDHATDTFTEDEILAALLDPAAPDYKGMKGTDIVRLSNKLRLDLRKTIATEKAVIEQVADAEERVKARRAQLKRVAKMVRELVDKVKFAKARSTYEAPNVKRDIRRNNDIYRHVFTHLEELREEVEAKDNDIRRLTEKLAALQVKEEKYVKPLRELAKDHKIKDGNPDKLEKALRKLIDRSSR